MTRSPAMDDPSYRVSRLKRVNLFHHLELSVIKRMTSRWQGKAFTLKGETKEKYYGRFNEGKRDYFLTVQTGYL